MQTKNDHVAVTVAEVDPSAYAQIKAHIASLSVSHPHLNMAAVLNYIWALERDAARYRWHERNHLRGSYIDYYEHGEQLVGYFVVDVRGGIFHYGEERYQTLDEAIDAAIAAGIGAA